MTAPLACPAGYYCPANSYFTGGGFYYEAIPCPAGTYNAFTSKSTLADCVACDPGKYCANDALIAVQGSCAAGYYC